MSIITHSEVITPEVAWYNEFGRLPDVGDFIVIHNEGDDTEEYDTHLKSPSSRKNKQTYRTGSFISIGVFETFDQEAYAFLSKGQLLARRDNTDKVRIVLETNPVHVCWDLAQIAYAGPESGLVKELSKIDTARSMKLEESAKLKEFIAKFSGQNYNF